MSLLFTLRRLRTIAFLTLLMFASGSLCLGTAQTVSFERERGKAILDELKEDIREHYYDPTFRGIDLNAHFKSAEDKIKQAASVGQIFGIIGQALVAFNDSHTRFLPPELTTRTEYGWQMQMVGDVCYVVAVQPGSDAEAQGLKPGDKVYSIERFIPTRDNLWILQYLYYALRPQSVVKLDLRSPDGEAREITIKSRVIRVEPLRTRYDEELFRTREAENESRLNRHRYYEVGQELMIWKMPRFDLSEDQVDELMAKARSRKSLILDLRGNPGGLVLTLQRLVGHFFDHDVKIADLKGRKELPPMVAKTRGDKIFKGNVVVLIDSLSGSASELFARVMQLEKRGTTIGDRSAGAVMRSRYHRHEMGYPKVIVFGASVTDADMIMVDGKSIEGFGVTPDEFLFPTAKDIGAGRDPVLARAAEILGMKLAPEKAGTLFPVEWKR